MPSAQALLLEIARCPNVTACFDAVNPAQPCAAIIGSQGAPTLAEFQVPEAWNGDLAEAPVMFLSSNPSISFTEVYPTPAWTDEAILDFFEHRFATHRRATGQRVWTRRLGALQQDGTYTRFVSFWAAIRRRTAELLNVAPEAVQLGRDCVLTEVVRCKSRGERGVAAAISECANRYLDRTLRHAGARVIVTLGKHAASIVRDRYNIPAEANVHGPVTLAGRSRYMTFLPHPNHRGVRTFEKCLTAPELTELRQALAH